MSWVSDWGGSSCQGIPPSRLDGGLPYEQVRVFSKQEYDQNGDLCTSCSDCCAGRYRYITCPPNYAKMNSPSDVEGFCMGPTREFVDQTQKAPDACDKCGNPINPSTGNKTQVEVDYVGQGPFPLVFKRTYNSSPSLGGGWTHNYQRRIEGRLDGDQRALVYRQNGSMITFNNGNNWRADSDITARLDGDMESPWTYWSGENDEIETFSGMFQGGKLISIKNRAGLTQTLAYDSNGHLYSVTDPAGRKLIFTYNANGQLSTMTDPANNVYTYTYAVNGNLISVTYPGNKTKNYLYENVTYPKALTGVVDENGNRYSTFTYNTQGLAIQTEHAGGVEGMTVNYGTPPQIGLSQYTNPNNGRVYASNYFIPPTGVTLTDAFGTTRNLDYQSVVGVVKRKGISGPACSYCGNNAAVAFDNNGNVTSSVDFNGNQTTYVYDLTRNLETSRTEAVSTALARTITTQWHSQYRLPAQIDEPGRRIAFNYDATGNLLQRTITDTSTNLSRTWTYTYNDKGQVLTEDGPRIDVTDVTRYTYDAQGNFSTITNAVGHITQISSYDANGRPLTIIAPNGLVTTLTYDGRGNLTSKRVGLNTTSGELTTYEYDNAGQLIKATLPNSTFLAYTYDAAHRLVQIQDHLGNKIVYTLDAMSNRIQEEIFNTAGNLVQRRSRVYDALNRLQQEIGGANPARQITQFAYDNKGNITSITDPLNHKTTYAYDAFDRLTQTLDANNGLVQQGYSPLDQLIGVIDPRNKGTFYTPNALGDVVLTQSPDTGGTRQIYDEAGNLIRKTDAKGQKIVYRYDELNRLIREVHPDTTIIYTYDDGPDQIGRLTRVKDDHSITNWRYDLWGRVIAKHQTIGSTVSTTRYRYDEMGQLTHMTYPSGAVIHYVWMNGQIRAIKNGTTLIANGIQYLPFGTVRRWNFNNGEEVLRRFDHDGRMRSNSLGDIDYDAAGRITSAYGRLYRYDALDRLKSYDDSVTLHTYSWDASGNRTSQSIGGVTNSYAIKPNNNQIQSISAGSVSKAYVHDNNGNVTTDGTYTFLYDSNNRLIQSNEGTTIKGSYTYNGLGQRIRKTADQSILFVYDESGQLIGEYSASGTPIQETVYLGNMPVAVLKDSAIYYVHTDHLNTPRKITDDSKNVRWQWNNATFGANPANENPNNLGVFKFNLRHPGQYADVETRLFYNYFRDYDPKTGRYLQSDPIGLDGGINTYAYVNGNPLSKNDPFGLAQSGPTVKIPGTNTTVRIDPPAPTHGDSQSHAHVCQKGCKEIVINKDGTGSHGTNPDDLKNKKVRNYLKGKGFKIREFGLAYFIADIWEASEAFAAYCELPPEEKKCVDIGLNAKCGLFGGAI